MSAARILVVEDNAVSALDIESKLTEFGYQVAAICATGEDAVQQALKLHPDLILMDIYLKGKMDGIEAAQKIRAHESVAVIYLTDASDEATFQRAKIAEPYGFFKKPISSQQLHFAIDVAVYRHTVHQEVSAQLQLLTAMCMVDEAILNSHDPHHALRVALHQITFQLDLDAAGVLLFNPTSRKLEFFEGYGSRTEAFHGICMDLGMDLIGRSSGAQQIEQVGDISKLPHIKNLDLMNKEGFIGYVVVPLFYKDQLKGVLEVFRRSPLDVDPAWLEFVKVLAHQVAVVIDNASIVEGLRATNINMLRSYDATIQGWASALEMRELEAQGHSQRVTEMTLKIARAMGIPERDMEHIWRGALLHDVGKMGIPEEILLKQGELTSEEWTAIRKHTSYARDLLSFIPFLKPALDISIYHHEHWDGSGYPEGLKGEAIPLTARIFAVVDVWDVLLTERPQHPAWPPGQVIEYLRQKSGSQFDPRVVDELLKLIV